MKINFVIQLLIKVLLLTSYHFSKLLVNSAKFMVLVTWS